MLLSSTFDEVLFFNNLIRRFSLFSEFFQRFLIFVVIVDISTVHARKGVQDKTGGKLFLPNFISSCLGYVVSTQITELTSLYEF